MIYRDESGDYWAVGKPATKAEREAMGLRTPGYTAVRIKEGDMIAALDQRELGEIAMEHIVDLIGARIKESGEFNR